MQIDFNEEHLIQIDDLLTLLKEDINTLNNNIKQINSNAPENVRIKTDLENYLSDTEETSILKMQLRLRNIMKVLATSGGNMNTLFHVLSTMEGQNAEIITNEYTLPDGVKYQITTIGSVNKNTPVLMFNHGYGQRNFLNQYNGGDYTYFYDWLENGAKGVFNAVIITYNRYAVRTSDDKQNVPAAQQILEDAKIKYGFSSDIYKFAGFSDGGEPAIKQAADACRVNINLQSPEIMLLDGNVNPKRGEIFTEDDLKILGERKAIIYVVERSNVRPDIKHHQKWASYGINVISVRDQFAQVSGTTGNTHMNVDADFTEKGLINYLTGQGKITTDQFRNNYDYFLPTTIFDKNTGEEIPFDIRGKTSNEVKNMLGLSSEPSNNLQSNIEINTNDIKYSTQDQISSNLIRNKMEATFMQTGANAQSVEPNPAYNLLPKVSRQNISNDIGIYTQQASPVIQKETIDLSYTAPITKSDLNTQTYSPNIETSYQQETTTYTYNSKPDYTNHIKETENTYNIEEYLSIPDTSVNENYSIPVEERFTNNYILPGIIITGISTALTVFAPKKEKISKIKQEDEE